MAGRTALIVLVPEADAVVGSLRTMYDPVARLGVPAHITVLFPFVPVHLVDDVVRRVRHMFAEVSAFEYRLVRTGWFGAEVLWLAPDAADRFRSLTEAVEREFPDYPPYEGKFDEVVPHLTVADGAPIDEMRTSERELQRQLPIRAAASAVSLMVERPGGGWELATSFPLR